MKNFAKLLNYINNKPTDKKKNKMEKILNTAYAPYQETAPDFIYNLLFCDDTELYKNNNQQPALYPLNILFADEINIVDLRKIINDPTVETRHKILAYKKLAAYGLNIQTKELLGVIVEVGLENGLDVIAAYKDGTARYINQTGKMIIWETPDETSNDLIKNLFEKSENIIAEIGPWNQPRKPFPHKGMVRINFLVTDGFYFGEGPADVFFRDSLAKPALFSAAALMQFLTEKVLSNTC